jgi:hypothetical protein
MTVGHFPILKISAIITYMKETVGKIKDLKKRILLVRDCL